MNAAPAPPCPNCRGDEFAQFPTGRATGLSAGPFRVFRLSRVVCLRCGLVRDWIARRNDLDRMRRRYGRSA